MRKILHRYKTGSLRLVAVLGTFSVLVQLLNFVDVLGVELGDVFPKVPLNLLQHNHRLWPVHQVYRQTMLKYRKGKMRIKLK